MSAKEEEIQKYIDWKIPFSIGIVFSFTLLFTLIALKYTFLKILNNSVIDKFYSMFVALLVINSGIATYTISLYYYRVATHGSKGATGNYGFRGDKGKSKSCDITTHKIRRFSFRKEPNPEKYVVDTSQLENTTLDLNKLNNDPEWFAIPKDENTIDNHILGAKKSNCLKEEKCVFLPDTGVIETRFNKTLDKEQSVKTNKPFIGALVNYSTNKLKDDGAIHTMQFLYDKNNKVKDKSKNAELVEGKIGKKSNFGTSDDFTCPPHSAIYKVETLHDSDRNNGESAHIKGIKFHCRDIESGNKIRVLDSENNLVDGIYYGVEPSQENKYYTYSSAECGMKDKSPGFIANFDSHHSNSPQGVQNLKFNYCTYYRK
jgi:hypothetical protein